MKHFIISGLLLLSLGAAAQKSAISDPSLGRISVVNISGQSLDVDNIPVDQVFRIKLPISNVNTGKPLPAGSCKIKLGFGSKLILDPSFMVNDVELNQYFSWSASMEGGQLQLTGELVNALPQGLVETGLYLKVKGNVAGTSTITANFLVSNHASGITLSDSDPTNNSTYLKYTIINKKTVVLMNITDVKRSACKVNVSFTTSTDPGIVRYDVETSRDGFNYVKVGEVAAGLSGYNTGFDISDAIKATDIFVRIRSVDRDGNYQYSRARMVSGSCDNDANPWVLSVYPNPATDVKAVEISAKQGVFKGKYKIMMLDISGRMAQMREMQLDNVQHFSYNIGNLSAGKYLIQVLNADGSQSAVLQFEKL